MSDIQILFSAPMVLALLREAEHPGTGKTQTRRVLKAKSGVKLSDLTWTDRPDGYRDGRVPVDLLAVRWQAGDRLYVREAWRTFVSLDKTPPSDLWRPGIRGAGIGFESDRGGLAIDKTGQRYDSVIPEDPAGRATGKLRPGIHMPRWASRLTLLVDEVRVERLQAISEEDAIAEGIHRTIIGDGYQDKFSAEHGSWSDVVERRIKSSVDPRDAFAGLWCSINGPESWAENPWVAALRFRVVKANIDQVTA